MKQKTFNNFWQAIVSALLSLFTIYKGFVTANIAWFVLTIVLVLALAIFTTNHGKKKVWEAR